MSNQYQDEDFVACLLYAGPYPQQPVTKDGVINLTHRLDWMDRCTEFCLMRYPFASVQPIEFREQFKRWIKDKQNETT